MDSTCGRHEFRIDPVSASRAVCRRLASPCDLPGVVPVELETEPGARAAVRRRGNVTIYEVAIPVESLAGVRLDAGREFCFSVLVHDPEGTGLRDLGERLNRPESARGAADGWVRWPGGCWVGTRPYDTWSRFGCCSSIH